MSDYVDDVNFQTELVKLAIAEALADRMEALDISRAELARRLDVSRSRVTQILAGYSNINIRTLVQVSMALDTSIYFELLRNDHGTNGVELVDVSDWPSTPPVVGEPSPNELAEAA